jgi:O-antigen/teichoic acid export membrane protein
VLSIKLPELLVKKEEKKAKGLMQFTLKIRSFVSFLVWIGYIIAAIIMIFSTDQQVIGYTLLILSPRVITRELTVLYIQIFNSLKLFSFYTYLLFLEKMILLIGYSIFAWNDSDILVKLYWMSFVNILAAISYIPPFLYLYFKKFKNVKAQPIKWKEIKESITFGSSFTVVGSIGILTEQIFYGVIKNSGHYEYITQYNICKNLTSQAVNAVAFPVASVLTDLEKTGQHDKMMRLFSKSIYFTSLILAFLTGCFYFIVEAYILVIFPPEYLSVIPIAQFYVLIIYFLSILANYRGLYTMTKNVKKYMYIEVIYSILFSITYFLSFKYLDFWGLILTQVIGTMVLTLTYWFHANFILKDYKTSFLTIYRHFIALILILVILNWIFPYFHSIFPYDNIIEWIMGIIENWFDWDIADQIHSLMETSLELVIFIVSYIIYISVFKGFTKKDMQSINNAGIKIPLSKLLSRFLR